MGDSTTDAVGPDLLEELTDFTFALRVAGLAVTIERSMAYLRAVAALDCVDAHQLYWAGRATLCCEPGDFAVYDGTFAAFFGHAEPGPPPLVLVKPVDGLGRGAAVDAPSANGDAANGDAANGDAAHHPVLASDAEVLRHKDLAELTDGERGELAAMLRMLPPEGPTRRSARRTPARRGALDPRRTVRSALRRGGEITALHRMSAMRRPRRLVLLIDVSGSMRPYADSLLRFAHAARRRLGPHCEVFTLGTSLTRLTRVLADRDPQQALDAAAQVIPDWSGGTRLGAALRAFLDQYGQRGMARGSVVIVFSDGWERGSAALLAEQAHRLSRLARSFLWVNPHSGKDGYTPVQSGIVAVQPYCDHLLAGHSLAALGELMDIARDA